MGLCREYPWIWCLKVFQGQEQKKITTYASLTSWTFLIYQGQGRKLLNNNSSNQKPKRKINDKSQLFFFFFQQGVFIMRFEKKKMFAIQVLKPIKKGIGMGYGVHFFFFFCEFK